MSTSNGAELPAYDHGSWEARSYADEGTSSRSRPSPSAGPSQRWTRKSDYALKLQNACNSALQRVKTNNVVANSNWASPLAAAPSAISTMAILLKAADQDAAAGLEIDSRRVMSLDGTTEMGALPSKYFHTDLQHCSDIGRTAFMDAQHGMSAIQATARSMTSEEGSIGYIIDLLEDPEDARHNLKPEIEAIKKTASKCLTNAKAITASFEYWYLVIIHLRQTSLTSKNRTVKEKEYTSTKQVEAAQDHDKFSREKVTLNAQIQDIKASLERAEKNVDRALMEVDQLRYEPITPEPSALEEIAKIERMIPNYGPKTKKRGFVVDIKNAFFGESDQHRAQDESREKTHSASITKMRAAAHEAAREQRHHQRQLAAERLRLARLEEDKMNAALTAIHAELADSNYQLNEAMTNARKAQSEMELLSGTEVELKAILKILDNSTENLGKLKNQIEPLVDFFRGILGEIDHQVDQNLEAFLRPIVNGMTESSSHPEEVEAINMSRRSKEKMMSTAFQMQARFTAITDISTAYIKVSNAYIRPAIKRMEELSTMEGVTYRRESRLFLAECEKAVYDIDGIAQETNRNVVANMQSGMDALRQRAIRAADEREEEEQEHR